MKEMAPDDPVSLILVMNKCDLDGMSSNDCKMKANEVQADKWVMMSAIDGAGIEGILDLKELRPHWGVLNSGSTAWFVDSDNYPSPNMMQVEELQPYEETKESPNDFIYMNRPDLDEPIWWPLPQEVTPQTLSMNSPAFYDPVQRWKAQGNVFNWLYNDSAQ